MIAVGVLASLIFEAFVGESEKCLGFKSSNYPLVSPILSLDLILVFFVFFFTIDKKAVLA